jgi:hypothetical protein
MSHMITYILCISKTDACSGAIARSRATFRDNTNPQRAIANPGSDGL